VYRDISCIFHDRIGWTVPQNVSTAQPLNAVTQHHWLHLCRYQGATTVAQKYICAILKLWNFATYTCAQCTLHHRGCTIHNAIRQLHNTETSQPIQLHNSQCNHCICPTHITVTAAGYNSRCDQRSCKSILHSLQSPGPKLYSQPHLNN
jgi:hypothetical protein